MVAGEMFPLRENCDLNNPEEAFLWMLVAMPGQNGGPLILPVVYLRQVSQRLWDLGARPVADPVLKYQRPLANDPHWMTSPGSWVSTDTPEVPADPAGRALASLSVQQKAEILERLLAERDDSS